MRSRCGDDAPVVAHCTATYHSPTTPRRRRHSSFALPTIIYQLTNRKSQITQSKIKPSVFSVCSVVIHYPLPSINYSLFPSKRKGFRFSLVSPPLKRNSSFVILHSSLFILPTTTCQHKWGSHSVRTPLKTQIEISTCYYRLLWQVRLITSSCCSRVRSMNFTA